MSPLAQSSGALWQGSAHAIITTQQAWSVQYIHATTPSAGTYPTSDLAIYVPVRVKRRVTVVKIHFGISTASGNVDAGIYTPAGVRLISTGTTAAAGGLVVDTTDTIIGPGLYYVGVVADNTTVQFYRDNDAAPLCAAQGLLTQQLGAGAALPATATWVVDQTLAFYPEVSLLLETTVA